MKRFDARFAKFAESNPDLTLAEAKKLEEEEPPAPKGRKGKRNNGGIT